MKLIIFSGGLSLLVVLLGTPLLIRLLRAKGYAQAIRVSTEDEPYPEHGGKLGTPSMGGLAMLAGILLGYLGAHLLGWRWPSVSGLLILFLVVGLGLVGMADDYLKIFKQRSMGLRGRTKLLGQAAVAIVFAFGCLQFPDDNGRTPASLAVSFFRDSKLVLPTALFVVWIWFLITAATNSVNLTDGLDGLATGAALLPFGAYTLLSVWQYGHDCIFGQPRCYNVRDPLDLAVFAAACAGACLGFLWWNTAPARIFMGDTGSLSLGGAIAGLAILSRTELLLPLLGGLFVIVALSVIGQVGSYKLTGRRMFRMAPLHHHFEMKGWPEVQIVVRFWVIQGICIAAALGLFYAEWIRQ